MFFDPPNLTAFFNKIISDGARQNFADKSYLQNEIAKWKVSKKRIEQITGDRYYKGFHDILQRKRTAIADDGKLTVVENLPNAKIINNQYEKVVTQKVNFLVGQPISFKSNNEEYITVLN